MPSSVDTKSEWNFPSNNYGQITGISDSGVETFNGTYAILNCDLNVLRDCRWS